MLWWWWCIYYAHFRSSSLATVVVSGDVLTGIVAGAIVVGILALAASVVAVLLIITWERSKRIVALDVTHTPTSSSTSETSSINATVNFQPSLPSVDRPHISPAPTSNHFHLLVTDWFTSQPRRTLPDVSHDPLHA